MSARRPVAPARGRAGAARPATAKSTSAPSTKASSASAASARPASRRTRPPVGRPGAADRLSARLAGTRARVRGWRAEDAVPRVFTARALVMFIVLLMAFVVLFPTLRAYLGQRSDLVATRQERDEAAGRVDDLTHELSRWDDPAYVRAQARERLAYVYPGETAYRVIDPGAVAEDVNPGTGKAVSSGPVDVGFANDTPWYATVWSSVEVAGTVEERPIAPDPDPVTDPAPAPTP